jgi:hypothetical protein
MQHDQCYKCKKIGHWSQYCPNNNNNNNNTNKHVSASATTLIYCPCGYGFCDIRDSKSEKNYGKSYFSCPIKRVCF